MELALETGTKSICATIARVVKTECSVIDQLLCDCLPQCSSTHSIHQEELAYYLFRPTVEVLAPLPFSAEV